MVPSDLDTVARTLESSLDAWGVRLLVATAIVVIGLIVEYWHEGSEIWRIYRWPMAHFPWDRIRALTGGILVTVGVALELYFTYRASGVESKLRVVNDQIQTSLRDRAAANEREAAQLQKDAEGLKLQAQSEALARAKIEAVVAWRSLDELQKREIGIDLARFRSKAGASIWFNGSSTEAELFADDIAEALRFGHIDTTAPGGLIEMRESGGKWNEPMKPASTGVIVQSTKVLPAPDFAEAIIKELASRGFDAKRQTDPPFDEKVNAPIVWVNVEPRPKGPQGEYKLQAEREAKAKNRTKINP